MLRFDHVAVAVVGKLCPQAVAGLAGFSVPDIVGENEKISGGIEQPAPPKKFAREFRPQKLRAAPGGAVQNQNGVADDALVVGLRRTEGAIMQSQFRKSLPGVKMKIADGIIALRRRGKIRRPRDRRRQRHENQGDSDFHKDSVAFAPNEKVCSLRPGLLITSQSG